MWHAVGQFVRSGITALSAAFVIGAIAVGIAVRAEPSVRSSGVFWMNVLFVLAFIVAAYGIYDTLARNSFWLATGLCLMLGGGFMVLSWALVDSKARPVVVDTHAPDGAALPHPLSDQQLARLRQIIEDGLQLRDEHI